ncbi:hypothetical protein C8Q79DRAFT_914120 [Trametes meyenii]|nr:hypothetical protein C8Q79DRAFT_914120 [Trametes meyenii]
MDPSTERHRPSHVRTLGGNEPEHKLGAAAILERKQIAVLGRLAELRQKGWDNNELDSHFATQRRVADSGSSDNEQYWYQTMQSVLNELDRSSHFIPHSETFEFLDVGCAPGGFSGCVLKRAPRASGTGISLPVPLGGHRFVLEREYSPRCHLIEHDILRYNLGVETPILHNVLSQDLVPLPEDFFARFALVMLDGHALRTYSLPIVTDSDGEIRAAHQAYRDALLIGQFIIGLSSVQPGDTIVVKLTHVECFPTAHLIYLLDTISESLVLHKPRKVHTNRGTFYAIAKGVGSGDHAEIMARYLVGLRSLWSELRCGGPYGTGKYLITTDLDFVVTADAILDDYLGRLVKLGHDVWSTQAYGLRQFLKKKGIR